MAFKPAIIVVDFQEDFTPPNGPLAVPGGRDIAPAINQLLSAPFIVRVATRDFHPQDHTSFASNHPGAKAYQTMITIGNPENSEEKEETLLWPDHCVQGTRGADLVPELDPSKLTHQVEKGQDPRVESYSAFGPPFRSPRIAESSLEETLQDAGITHVFCVGVAFDYCVKFTAIDAAQEGFVTYVIEAATKAVDQSEAGLEATRKELAAKGVSVISLDSKEIKMVQELKV